MKMLKFDESYNLREVPDKVKEHYLSRMALGSDVPHVHDLVNDVMCLVDLESILLGLFIFFGVIMVWKD